MIRRLFVANRGEIALRIIRTARRLGMTTILGASEADRESLPALAADEVAIVGPAASAESYLSIDRMIAAARQAKADAIHPATASFPRMPPSRGRLRRPASSSSARIRRRSRRWATS
jgi:acetyl/propionyl-CoA carboxylase alpha subunit